MRIGCYMSYVRIRHFFDWHFFELLAPAKNIETGIAAVNYGADAVYIGANKFGARKEASNTIADIEKLINYSHKFNVKVYAAINTILYEHELEEVALLIKSLYNIGIDALIIQDMGILEMDLPPIPLHASTQTNNYDINHIKFLSQIGFKRIILARELSYEQIIELRKLVKCELEVFIHGALCVCMSGQCYMSASIGKRSGNRGECAQPCREKYSLVDSKNNFILENKYFLSVKDLNHSNNIEKLMNVGIDSFKIEGRLKNINYVKNVAHYRLLIDKILENKPDKFKSSSGKVYFDFIPDIHKTYNRLYTDYFFNGRNTKICNIHSPKSFGKYIGKVSEIFDKYFTIVSKEQIYNGDGIVFFDENNHLNGLKINSVDGMKIYPNKMKNLKVGFEVFRNFDAQFENLLKKNQTVRKISVKLNLKEINNGFFLLLTDEDGNSVEEIIEIKKEIALRTDNIMENIKKQLKKFGETIFIADEITIDFIHKYFIPFKVLNSVRGKAVSKLELLRLKKYNDFKVQKKLNNNSVQYPLTELDYTWNISNSLAKLFYKKHGVNKIENAIEISQNKNNKYLMKTKMCIKYELEACPVLNPKKILLFFEPLYLTNNKFYFKLEFDCKNCIMKVTNVRDGLPVSRFFGYIKKIVYKS